MAVTLNLFFAPLWVFSFGIFPSNLRGDQKSRNGPILFPRRSVLARYVFDVEKDPIEDQLSELRLLLLAAAQHDGDLDLVAIPKEALDVFHLEIVVMDADLRPELDLFDLDLLLVLLGFVVLLVLFVQELAVVGDLAHGGVRRGRNLDEVETAFAGQLESLARGQDAEGVSLLVDDPDLPRLDHLVDPVGLGLGDRRIEGVSLDNVRSSFRN